MNKTLIGPLRELKNKKKVKTGNPKVVAVAYGTSRLRELLITKFKSQFKRGFTKVVVLKTRVRRLREWYNKDSFACSDQLLMCYVVGQCWLCSYTATQRRRFIEQSEQVSVSLQNRRYFCVFDLNREAPAGRKTRKISYNKTIFFCRAFFRYAWLAIHVRFVLACKMRKKQRLFCRLGLCLYFSIYYGNALVSIFLPFFCFCKLV